MALGRGQFAQRISSDLGSGLWHGHAGALDGLLWHPPTAVLPAEAFFSSSCLGYAAVQASRSLVSYVDFLPVGCCCCRLLLAVRLKLTRAAHWGRL